MEEELRGLLTARNIRRVSKLLRSGGIAVMPTDTVYGIHCISTDESAIDRIRRMKGKGRVAGMILLVADMGMAGRLVSQWPRGSREWLEEIWPARLTAVLPADESLDASLRPGGGVAVRMPCSTAIREIIAHVGAPLISTSANKSGMPPIRRMSDIRKAFPGLGAYMTKRGRQSTLPSTVMDLRSRPFRVLRPGAFDPGPAPDTEGKRR